MNRECVLPNTCKDIPVTFTSMTIYDVNDSEFPPVNGIYFNTIVTYKITGHVYMYDSEGVPSLMNDMSINVDDALSTTSKNPVQNAVITNALNQTNTNIGTQLAEVRTQIINEADTRAQADATLNEKINDATQSSTEALGDAVAGLENTISTGLASKVDVVEGKGLSTNDFSNADQEKLAGIEGGAQVNPTKLSELTNDAGYQTGADVEAAVAEAVSTSTEALNLKLDKNLIQSVAITDNGSTDVVSLTNGLVNLSTGATSSQEVPLPVASAESAGVINPSLYNSIQDSAEKVDVILNGAVAVADLAAEPTQEQLTTAWETATGRDELVNGAKIYDQTNNKTWTYYSNATTWYATANSGTGTISQFTNDTAGIIKGSTADGQIFAEADGTGSVNGWDDLNSKVNNLENNQYELPVASTSQLGGIKMGSGTYQFLTTNIEWASNSQVLLHHYTLLNGGTQKNKVLNVPEASATTRGFMSIADKVKVDNMPEFEVVTEANDPGEGSELAANKVIFVVADSAEGE